MNDLFGNPLPPPGEKPQKLKGNPMVAKHGPGTTAYKCKHCTHCYYKQYAGRYYKCGLRGDTNGPGTDHRANWPTCSKFQLDTSRNK